MIVKLINVDATHKVVLDILELSCSANVYAEKVWNFLPLSLKSSSLSFNLLSTNVPII